MLRKNIVATINSDDPAYFRGYINENYEAVAQAFILTKKDILKLAKNSFKASFLDEHAKGHWLRAVKNYYKKHN